MPDEPMAVLLDRSRVVMVVWVEAEAQREDSGRKMTAVVRTLEEIAGTSVANCRIEKRAGRCGVSVRKPENGRE